MLKLPSKEKLPEGPRRRFVKDLWVLYRTAGRPSLRDVAAWIEGQGQDLPGTASTETIRRVLVGETTPRWGTVEAIVEALCALAERSSDQDFAETTDRWYPSLSVKEQLRMRWNQMVDDEEGGDDEVLELPPAPAPAAGFSGGGGYLSGGGSTVDPWSTPAAGAGGSAEDPPF